jgi:hypothetical protein
MKTFSGLVENAVLEELKKLLDKGLYVIYSPGLKVLHNHVEASSFSLPQFGSSDDWQHVEQWVNFRSRFVKTLDEHSFHQLEISITSEPDEIKVRDEQGKKSLIFPYSSYIIKMEAGWQVEKIDLYRKSEDWINMKLNYDYAVIFHLPGKKEITIYSDDGTGDRLMLTEDPSILAEVKKRGEPIFSISSQA